MVKGKRQGDNAWYLEQTNQEQGNFVKPIIYIVYLQDILRILSPNENNFRLNEQKEYWFRFDSIGRCKLLQSFTQKYKSSKHELGLNTTDKYS